MVAHVWFDVTGTLTVEENISSVLDCLRKKVPISVFSNYSKARLEEVLRQIGIPAAYFTHIVSSNDVGAPKPAPDGFNKMIELSGVEPAQVMYVGDQVETDILPAERLGIQTCLIYSYNAAADFHAGSMQELVELVTAQLADSGV